VSQVQVANLAPTTYAYDSRGRIATVTQGAGAAARVVSATYDAKDRPQAITDPLLRTESYTYDDADRITVQTLPDGQTIGYAYDANGNVTGLTPPGKPTGVVNSRRALRCVKAPIRATSVNLRGPEEG
jgi:YD repeat-containing protein